MKDEHVKEVEKLLTPELQLLAKTINDILPKGWGFGLLIFEMNNDPDGPLLWVSSARREDMTEAMKEFIKKQVG